MKKKNTQDKLTENLRRVLKQYVQGRAYSPLSLTELMQKLGFPEQHTPTVKILLNELCKTDDLELINGRYSLKKNAAEIITGVIRVHIRGFGFVQPENTKHYEEDIFIPKHLTMNAVDGDIVEVVVNTESISEKGPEGKVVSILERGRTHIAGIIRDVTLTGDIAAYVPLLGTSKKVHVQTSKGEHLKVGDRVVMEVEEWGDKDTPTLARYSHHIGHIDDPSCDIPAAIEEYELRSEFPAKVVKEAVEYGKTVSKKDLKGREDLRDTVCFTIDPDTAKDFDDAISLSKDSKGHYHLGVHIADVSHYVKAGTALDKEAALRCNSTYFPAFCLPMLPRELSDNLCSLKPNVIRLTASVFCEFDREGNMVNHRIARTFIKSAKRFTYREAKDVLDGKVKSKHINALKLMVEMCALLKRKRYERGSIEFALPELVVLVDEKGVPQKTDYISYDITHQLVEEFMLKANEVVAWHLTNLGKELTYRIHDQPAEDNMRDFALLAGAFGFKISDKPSSAELQKLFDEALSTPYGPYLATSFIRRMRLAVYSPENIGHYGLALTHYCHFTSPIRRYVDLVVHRILFGDDANREHLTQVAEDCSEQERISARAESSVVLLKKLRLLNTLHKADPGRSYEAVITRVKPFGFTFEVLELMLEGFVHVSDLADDYFVYVESRMHLRGRHTGQVYSPGDRIQVHLKSVDFILSETEWYLSVSRHQRKRSEAPREREEKTKVQKFKEKISKDKKKRPPIPPKHVLRKAKKTKPPLTKVKKTPKASKRKKK
jgi:ribonuclease R